MNKLKDLLNDKNFLVSDGAWGTYLFKLGLQPGDCPEEWNLKNSAAVLNIARSYIDAGSDIVSTNSFGGSRLKLKQYGLENAAFQLNKSAATISREAAGNKIVFGSIGPSGKFLITGEVEEGELYESYKEQSVALKDGGADAILLETFYDIEEAVIAIKSIRENTNLMIACSFTFDKQPDGSYKTIMGISPAVMTAKLIELEVDIIGSNCGMGFRNIIEVAAEIRKTDSKLPLIIQANAGLPKVINDELIYSESPEYITQFIEELLRLNVNIIGGCCGTTPEHIKIIRKIVDKHTELK